METKVFKNTVILLLILLSVASACKKKYPEDPGYTTKDVNVRLTGEWQATKLTIAGVDRLSIIDSLNIDRYRFIFPKSDNMYRSRYVGDYHAIDKQGNEMKPDTAFSQCAFFGGDKELTYLSFSPTNGIPELEGPSVFFPGFNQYTHLSLEGWEIKMLTKEELKFKSLEYDIVIEMKKVKKIKVE